MATQAIHRHLGRSELPRWILTGAVSGAIAVLLFHQGVVAVLHNWGVVPNPPFVLEPTRPFGVPVVASLAFWGGVWGAVLAASLARLRGAALVLASTAFGAASLAFGSRSTGPIRWLSSARLAGSRFGVSGAR